MGFNARLRKTNEESKAQLLCHIPARTAHPSDLRSRLTARLRKWGTLVPKVCACDAQCCREEKHVHCGLSNPTRKDPSVALSVDHCVVVCTSETAYFLRVCWRDFPNQVFGRFRHSFQTSAISLIYRFRRPTGVQRQRQTCGANLL